MRPLSAAELMDLWEEGQTQTGSQVWRALLLLAAACPDTPPRQLAQLSIGQRDLRLLRLREWTFGDRLDSLLACPQCGEQLEFSFRVADITAEGEDEDAGAAPALTLDVDGFDVEFRLPNSLDILAVSTEAAADAARSRLLERCLLNVRREPSASGRSGNGAVAPPQELPPAVLEAVVARMAEADPLADVQLPVECPACGHAWMARFDIVSYFWDELNAWAQRILGEVHALATAYGWSEAEILEMSAWRRQRYLEMVTT